MPIKNVCCDVASDDYITDLGISKHSMLCVILCIHLFKLLWKTDSSYLFDGLYLFIFRNLNGKVRETFQTASNKRANPALRTL